MRSGWETYKGKRIMCARYDHLTVDELRAEVAAVKQEMAQPYSGEMVLVLVDTRGTLISPAVLDLFKEVTASAKKFKFKTAILGMTGPRRVFLEIMWKFSGVKAMPFDEVEKAKEWLVS